MPVVVDTDVISFLYNGLLLDVPLITHNGAHYSGVEGLQVISEA